MTNCPANSRCGPCAGRPSGIRCGGYWFRQRVPPRHRFCCSKVMRSHSAPAHGRRAGGPVSHLSLRRLVLCLDCETCFEILTSSCPACGGDSWVLLSKFLNPEPLKTLSRFQPLPNSLAESPSESARAPVVKQLLIVARDRHKLYDHVKRA